MSEAIFKALSEPFPPTELQWRIGSTSGNKGMALPYVTSRAIMRRLDEVVGPMNWSDTYEKVPGTAGWLCSLRIRIDDQWIVHVDGADERPLKGQETKSGISDSLKRAAVKFGIGRYLYYLPRIWAPLVQGRIPDGFAPPLPSWALPGGSGFPDLSAAFQRAAALHPSTSLPERTPEPQPKATRGDGVAQPAGDPPADVRWTGIRYWQADGPNASVKPAPLGSFPYAGPDWFDEVHGMPGSKPLDGWSIPVKDMTWRQFADGSLGGQRYNRLIWEIENITLRDPKWRLDHERHISRAMATVIWMEECRPKDDPIEGAPDSEPSPEEIHGFEPTPF